ncbi:cellulose binding domain-containing protein [Conexibacter sp. JD483]|uniref:cellulose binding domain-containing protein n=1 Tax=unclassified Conexibacter TaxID=2627773 RepID=UPI002725A9DC|nr:MULTISPECIES: cellulose binding domain-containing protein [unclassified Conexibacter]MDO8189120.1 cellulose binding domain-containing protein [Conexibacter sp. CPCC 205706]MDO8201885.1 cellulose binding domain-containing protein [Conexibacter sp. CPCC 205762]MDR9371735.1 cellulose binding domain-containing protein [Conexibacter sp. JD483]
MSRSRNWLVGAATVAALAAATAGAAAPASAAGPLTATFEKTSDWGSGFVGAYVIRNGGTTPVSGWEVRLTLPAGARLTSAWSGVLSGTGTTPVLSDESWTRTIAAGGSVRIGLQGVASGLFPGPLSCSVNGQPCGPGDPTGPQQPEPPRDTTPPTVPAGLATASAPTQTSVALRWNPSTDAVGVSGYRLFRDGQQIAETTATSATAGGLQPDTAYRFSVRAFDAAGNVSADSAPLSVRTAAPPPQPSGGVTAALTLRDDWGSGFTADMTIRNRTSAPLSGWQLELQLPAGVSVSGVWSAKAPLGGGVVSFTPEEWTRTVPAGGAVSFGFQTTAPGRFSGLLGCSLNGRACDDGGSVPPPDTTAPTAPTGLRAGAVTASSVALSWSAASDDRGVAAYDVYDGAQRRVATSDGTSVVVAGLQPNTSYAFAVKARDAAGNVSPASAPVSATTAREETSGGVATAPGYAPYVDMTLYPQFPLARAATTPGLRQVSLAFVVSGGPCAAKWGGVTALDDPWISGQIAAFRAAGGTPIVSFGGAINQELALTCSSVDALAAEYRRVIEATGSRDLDFDIEGSAQGDAASLERRAKAIARLQSEGAAAGRPVRVSFTLPVMPSGLTADGLRVLRNAIDNGVDVGTVNVMAMDYFDPSLNVTGRMGDLAIEAATSLQRQLTALYPNRSAARLWKMVGVTPMIGINDNPAEIFTIADATKLTAFANQSGLGRLAIWSANRDSQCPGPRQVTENTCSGTAQQTWGFAQAFGSFPAAG